MKDLLQKSKTELISELHNVRAQLAAALKQASQQASSMTGVNEDELRRLMPEAGGDEVFLATETGRFVYANELTTGRLGYESHEVPLLTIPDIDQERSRGDWLSLVLSLKRSGKPVTLEAHHIARDGMVLDKKIQLKYVNLNSKNYVLGVAELKKGAVEVKEPGSGIVNRESFIMNVMFDGVMTVDTKGAVRDTNQPMELLIGHQRNEILGRSYLDPRWRLLDEHMNPLKLSDHPLGVALVEESPVMRKKVILERSDGGHVPLSVNAIPIYDTARKHSGAMACFRTCVEEPEEEEQEQDNRLTIREIETELSRMIFQWESIHVVRRYVCESLVKAMGLGLAWIGSVKSNDVHLEPEESAGDKNEFLLKTKMRWDDTEFGRGPFGSAVRLGTVQVVDSIHTDASMAPWRRQALQFGFRSTVAYPIQVGDEKFGVLSLFAMEERFFTPERVASLNEILVLLSFGWATLTQRSTIAAMTDHCAQFRLEMKSLLQSSPVAVALFDALPPFRCVRSNAVFSELLDNPYKRNGIENLFLSDFVTSCLHRTLYDDMQTVLRTGVEENRVGDMFTDWAGAGAPWDWKIIPLMMNGEPVELMYIAWPSNGGNHVPHASDPQAVEAGTHAPANNQPHSFEHATAAVAEVTRDVLVDTPAEASTPANHGAIISEAFDVVQQGLVCLEMPEPPLRARKDKRIQHVYNQARVTICNFAATRLLGHSRTDTLIGGPARDILPASDDFGEAMDEALFGKAKEACHTSTQESPVGGFLILNYHMYPERTDGRDVRLWITVTEMS